MASKRSYAFVTPRFGAEATGAETLTGNIARQLAARGDHVEVFTTCAKDNRTWENEYDPGSYTEYDVPVHRFPVDDRDLEIWIPRQINISEGMMLSTEDQLEWMQHSVSSVQMYQEILKRADDFDAFFFAIYFFGTTFWGSQLLPDKSYLIPCLHDECYAYLEVVQWLFKNVAGSMFNCGPEMDLARSLYGDIPGGVVGMGFDPVDPVKVEGLKPYFEEDFPYLIYLGRKETGKNVHLLIDAFVYGKEQGIIPEEVKLAIVGPGSFSDLHREEAKNREDILDIGYVSEKEKQELIRYSSALVAPASGNESFSIVIMEAWQLNVPVIVHGHSPVTKDHVLKSGGGLYFSSEEEFAFVVQKLLSDTSLQKAFGEAGSHYVATEYNWGAVLDRFDSLMERMLELRNLEGELLNVE